MNQNEKQVRQHLSQLGYSKKQIAGIMANISVETGGTFDYTIKQKGGNGYGLFQFDYLRKHYENYLKQKNIKDSARAQINFMHSTIRGQNKSIIGEGNVKKINQTFKNGTTKQITQCFCYKWQRPGVPHIQRRLEAAEIYQTKFYQSKEKNEKQIKNNAEKLNSTSTSLPSFNFGSSSSSGFGLSNDRSNIKNNTEKLNSTSTSLPSFNFGSSSSSGFGLSNDRSNIGYSFDNGTRISGGYSSGPKIQISIPCEIM